MSELPGDSASQKSNDSEKVVLLLLCSSKQTLSWLPSIDLQESMENLPCICEAEGYSHSSPKLK